MQASIAGVTPAIRFFSIMKRITSRENAIYKDALKLTRKKYRDQSGLFLLEGVKTLKDAADTGARVERVFVDERRFEEMGPDSLLLDLGEDLKARVCILDSGLFKEISDTENSQGVVSVAAKPRYDSPDEGLKSIALGANLVVLDRLQDPGNIGTIIRTAEAAGYCGIVAIKGTGDIYAPKTCRAAAGSLLRMPAVTCENAAEAAELLHGLGKKIAVTCLEDAVSCFEADLTRDIALVIGNEGRGVSRDFMDLADIKVTIPMKGRIESLNAAVAAGILMYQSVGGKI